MARAVDKRVLLLQPQVGGELGPPPFVLYKVSSPSHKPSSKLFLRPQQNHAHHHPRLAARSALCLSLGTRASASFVHFVFFLALFVLSIATAFFVSRRHNDRPPEQQQQQPPHRLLHSTLARMGHHRVPRPHDPTLRLDTQLVLSQPLGHDALQGCEMSVSPTLLRGTRSRVCQDASQAVSKPGESFHVSFSPGQQQRRVPSDSGSHLLFKTA
jgi:hypothetical protein